MYIQVLILVTALTLTMGQFGPFGRKPGECPLRPNVGICEMDCYNDLQCLGTRKCCRTACGGAFCTSPVIQEEDKGKPGDCPSKPTGPWVCSSRCAVDTDCRGKNKCCKNRCGAFACTKPAEENNEIPLY